MNENDMNENELYNMQRVELINAMSGISRTLLIAGHIGISAAVAAVGAILKVCKTEDELVYFTSLIQKALELYSSEFREHMEKAHMVAPAPPLPPKVQEFISKLEESMKRG